MLNPNCHFGDHDFLANGHCKHCDKFNGSWLQWQAHEKAAREGRHHGNHYHWNQTTAMLCKEKTHDREFCADNGGCFYHEPSDKFMEALYIQESGTL